MVTPAGSLQIFDGLATLAGVSSPATARRPLYEVAPAPAPPRRDPDRVELSPEAREATALTKQEQQEVEQLRKQDREVRIHEQAHKTAAGPQGGPISFTYTTGPDGKRYAVAGEVAIDVSPVEGDREATLRKMQQVRSAALAPAEPSAADRRIAAQAQQIERDARAELTKQEQGGPLDVFG